MTKSAAQETLHKFLIECIAQLIEQGIKTNKMSPEAVVHLTEKLGSLIRMIYSSGKSRESSRDDLLEMFETDISADDFDKNLTKKITNNKKTIATFGLALTNARIFLGDSLSNTTQISVFRSVVEDYYLGAEALSAIVKKINTPGETRDAASQPEKGETLDLITDQILQQLSHKVENYLEGTTVSICFFWENELKDMDLQTLKVPALVLDANKKLTDIIICKNGTIIKHPPTNEQITLIEQGHIISREHISDMAVLLDRSHPLIEALGTDLKTENHRTHFLHLCNYYKLQLLLDLPKGMTEDDIFGNVPLYCAEEVLDKSHWNVVEGYESHDDIVQQYRTLDYFTRLLENDKLSDNECIDFISRILIAEESSVKENAVQETLKNPSSSGDEKSQNTPQPSIRWPKIIAALTEKLSIWKSMLSFKFFSNALGFFKSSEQKTTLPPYQNDREMNTSFSFREQLINALPQKEKKDPLSIPMNSELPAEH